MSAELDRNRAFPFEGYEVEDIHEALIAFEFGEVFGPCAGTASSEVIDPVVAVRRNAELAEPAIDQVRRGFDRDGAHKDIVGGCQDSIATETPAEVCGSRVPEAGIVP